MLFSREPELNISETAHMVSWILKKKNIISSIFRLFDLLQVEEKLQKISFFVTLNVNRACLQTLVASTRLHE